jgi:hypothetical protein
MSYCVFRRRTGPHPRAKPEGRLCPETPGSLSSVGRAPSWYIGGGRIEACRELHAPVAQSGRRQLPQKERSGGSNPPWRTIRPCSPIRQRRRPQNPRDGGSSPPTDTTFPKMLQAAVSQSAEEDGLNPFQCVACLRHQSRSLSSAAQSSGPTNRDRKFESSREHQQPKCPVAQWQSRRSITGRPRIDTARDDHPMENHHEPAKTGAARRRIRDRAWTRSVKPEWRGSGLLTRAQAVRIRPGSP